LLNIKEGAKLGFELRSLKTWHRHTTIQLTTKKLTYLGASLGLGSEE
jgi:hypothetical protein